MPLYRLPRRVRLARWQEFGTAVFESRMDQRRGTKQGRNTFCADLVALFSEMQVVGIRNWIALLRHDRCNPIFPGSFAFNGYAPAKRAGEAPTDAAAAVAAACAAPSTGRQQLLWRAGAWRCAAGRRADCRPGPEHARSLPRGVTACPATLPSRAGRLGEVSGRGFGALGFGG